MAQLEGLRVLGKQVAIELCNCTVGWLAPREKAHVLWEDQQEPGVKVKQVSVQVKRGICGWAAGQWPWGSNVQGCKQVWGK